MKKRAIALIRVSGAGQSAPDRHGLPVQEEICKRIARTHELEIVEWVRLPGVSGASVQDDPRFQAMQDSVRRCEVQAVIVAAFDRLFRRGRFADFGILDDFIESGTALYTADGPVNLEQEAGGLLSVIRGELAGMERRRIIQRTRDGRRRKRREKGVRAEGLVGMPRAVTFCHVTGKWNYVWPEARAVQEAFRLFLAGERNLAEISRQTGIGTEKYRSQAVRSALTQPLYKGVYRVDRLWDGGKPTRLPQTEIQEHLVLEPPLIDPEDWTTVQRILASMTRPPARNPEALPSTYHGHLVCGDCLRPKRVHVDRRGYVAYHCDPRYTTCAGTQVAVKAADARLHVELERVLGDPEALTLMLDRALQAQKRSVAPSAAELGRRLTLLQNKRSRVRDAYEAGVYDLHELQKREASIAREKAVIEAQMATDDTWEPDEGLIDTLVEVFGSWAGLPRESKRTLLREWRIEIVGCVKGPRRRRWFEIERVRTGALPAQVEALLRWAFGVGLLGWPYRVRDGSEGSVAVSLHPLRSERLNAKACVAPGRTLRPANRPKFEELSGRKVSAGTSSTTFRARPCRQEPSSPRCSKLDRRPPCAPPPPASRCCRSGPAGAGAKADWWEGTRRDGGRVPHHP